MKKISSVTSTATSDGLFTNGSVATGVSPTILDAGWFNTIQKELVAIVEGSGLVLDPDNDAQVLAALKNLFLTRANPFADIASDGSAAIAKALANLGLGNGSALPVGVPVPWPLSAAPAGWLKCNGASFSATTYPVLAQSYPTLKLPDLRGEFLRGWDDGRGVDTSRVLLSAQSDAIRNIAGTANPVYTGTGSSASGAMTTTVNTGTVSIPSASGGSQAANTLGFDASRVVPTAAENRPRNIAFNYIVRAA